MNSFVWFWVASIICFATCIVMHACSIRALGRVEKSNRAVCRWLRRVHEALEREE